MGTTGRRGADPYGGETMQIGRAGACSRREIRLGNDGRGDPSPTLGNVANR